VGELVWRLRQGLDGLDEPVGHRPAFDRVGRKDAVLVGFEESAGVRAQIQYLHPVEFETERRGVPTDIVDRFLERDEEAVVAGGYPRGQEVGSQDGLAGAGAAADRVRPGRQQSAVEYLVGSIDAETPLI